MRPHLDQKLRVVGATTEHRWVVGGVVPTLMIAEEEATTNLRERMRQKRSSSFTDWTVWNRKVHTFPGATP